MEPKFMIKPTGFYTPSQLEDCFGVHTLQVLRGFGLRAVGDIYVGQSILDSVRLAVSDRGERASSRKEIENEKEECLGSP